MTDPCAARLAARFITAVSYDQLAHIPHKYRVKYRVKYPLLPYLVPGMVRSINSEPRESDLLLQDILSIKKKLSARVHGWTWLDFCCISALRVRRNDSV